MLQNKPVGIFDSGIGGLTVAEAIKNELPNEQLIYFGDTAHLPYGDKSTATIQAYTIKIADFFLQHSCKVIIIACNSASAVANDLLKEYVASKATIINVIEPMVDHIVKKSVGKTIGVIGTRKTINSNIYPNLIARVNPNIKVKSLATPLLAPMIEEGFIKQKIARDIIDKYLISKPLENIDSLILACTHYPLIKNEISDFFMKKVEILDSSIITAKFLNYFLSMNNLLSTHTKKGSNEFYVSDLTESFNLSARLFFGNPINLKMYKLWE